MSTISDKRDSEIPSGVPSNGKQELSASNSSDTLESDGFDAAATKRLLRKLDWRIMPIFALIYLLCFLDRSNIGNARLDGLEEDLGMKGLDYNIALSVFYPFYIAVEIPSQMLMKKLRPGLWLTIINVSWSIIMVSMGLVHNLTGMIVARSLLGLAEGGVYPGVVYYITRWYPRYESGYRIALFFSMATAAGAFGGLFARGISEMSGIGGKAGWSWIFIIEGLLTLCVGTICCLCISDYPSTAKFLTEPERKEVLQRLENDRHQLSQDFKMDYVWQALKDWKIYIYMLLALGLTTPLYALALFLPTIVKDMGYTANSAQLMTVPPSVVACACTISASYFADKAQQRGVFILGFQSIGLLGFSLLISSGKPSFQYAGAFLACLGVNPCLPLITTWAANNMAGDLKRGVGIAMLVGFSNFGGILASFAYRSVDAPRFIEGHAILIGLLALSFSLTAFLTIYFRKENARRDARDRERGLSIDSYTEEMKHAQRDRGDAATFWRYTY